MNYCQKHCLFFERRCGKCVNKEPAYKRDRTEVASPVEWRQFVKLGWTR
jgi:hypothetical protein